VSSTRVRTAMELRPEAPCPGGHEQGDLRDVDVLSLTIASQLVSVAHRHRPFAVVVVPGAPYATAGLGPRRLQAPVLRDGSLAVARVSPSRCCPSTSRSRK